MRLTAAVQGYFALALTTSNNERNPHQPGGTVADLWIASAAAGGSFVDGTMPGRQCRGDTDAGRTTVIATSNNGTHLDATWSRPLAAGSADDYTIDPNNAGYQRLIYAAHKTIAPTLASGGNAFGVEFHRLEGSKSIDFSKRYSCQGTLTANRYETTDFSVTWTPVAAGEAASGTPSIRFTVTCGGVGWCAIGWARTGPVHALMDTYTGLVSSGGVASVTDRFSFARAEPFLDQQSNVAAVSGSEVNGQTIISFERAISTGDSSEDRDLSGALFFQWAFHATSDDITNSHTHAGVATISFDGSGATLPPPPPTAPPNGVPPAPPAVIGNRFATDDQVFQMVWELVEGGTRLQFTVNAYVRGYVGFGWSRAMPPHINTDMYIGWVDDAGVGHLVDTWSLGEGKPVADPVQDATLVSSSERGGITTLVVSRALNTGDDKDLPIADESIVLHWCYNDRDSYEEGELHQDSGVAAANFIGTTVVPLPPPPPPSTNPGAGPAVPGGPGADPQAPGDNVPDLGTFVSPDSTFRMTWELLAEGKVEWVVEAEVGADAYFGFGWGQDVDGFGHENADMFVGWCTADGGAEVVDTYSQFIGIPTTDANNDYELVESSLSGLLCRLVVRRALVTGEAGADFDIEDKDVLFQWAYHTGPYSSGGTHVQWGTGVVNWYTAVATSLSSGAGNDLPINAADMVTIAVLIACVVRAAVLLCRSMRRRRKWSRYGFRGASASNPLSVATYGTVSDKRGSRAYALQNYPGPRGEVGGEYNALPGRAAPPPPGMRPPAGGGGFRGGSLGPPPPPPPARSFAPPPTPPRALPNMTPSAMRASRRDADWGWDARLDNPVGYDGRGGGGGGGGFQGYPETTAGRRSSRRRRSGAAARASQRVNYDTVEPLGRGGHHGHGGVQGGGGYGGGGHGGYGGGGHPSSSSTAVYAPVGIVAPVVPVPPKRRKQGWLDNLLHQRFPRTQIPLIDVAGFAVYLLGNIVLLIAYPDSLGNTLGYLAIANGFLVAQPASRNSVLSMMLRVAFDRTIAVHRWLGRFVVLLAVAHPLGYLVDKPQVLADMFSVPKYTWGFLSSLFAVLILATSTGWMRRSHFEWFYYTHFFFVGFYAFAALHSPTVGLNYVIATAVLYGIDRLVRFFWGAYPRRASSVRALSGGLVRIRFPRHKWARYSVGNYVFVNFPSMSMLQWHPYTLTNGPDDDELEINIKSLGDHTAKLHDLARREERMWLRVDGPYGRFSLDHKRYPTVVLIGGGVGVTPLIALLRDVFRTDMSEQRRSRIPRGAHHIERVCFVWVCPDMRTYSWFQSTIEGCRARSGQQGFPQFADFVHLTRDNGAVPAPLKTGRPDLGAVFGRLKGALQGAQGDSGRVAVFACGPTVLVNAAWDQSTVLSKGGKVTLEFHSEVFDW